MVATQLVPYFPLPRSEKMKTKQREEKEEEKREQKKREKIDSSHI